MNEANQGSNPDFPGNFPVKRKRGRPRKDQSKKRGENARIPPGFEGVDANLPLQVEPINVVNDAMVGQVVSGVVDASFDAGYLLTVRVGNSDTILKGVVFKPGRYVPISSENDVAPHVQMIRRNEIHLPAGNQSQEQGYNPQARERNEQHGNFQGNDTAHPWNGSPPANHVPRVVPRAANVAVSKGKQVQTVVTQTVAHPVGERGTLVPVVLPPASQSNEAPPVNLVPPPDIQAANPAASKGKQVLAAALQGPHSSNGSTSNSQISAVAKVMKNEDTFHQTPAEVVYDAECRSMRMPNMPFETLLGEVVKRIQVPSQLEEGRIQDIQDSGRNSEEGHNMNQALIVKPLQAVQPNHHDHTASAPQHLDNNMTSRMTELLQALPDYVRESQVPGVQDAATSSGHDFDEPRNQEEATGDSLQ
ncbi:hypothetical protein PVL29_025666 [Vitis rotundifolia]|uniref:AT hook motif-containing protein n=1 Tax=Vitis rotundifolia TaxID=103349 RepID=A0AA38YKF3_VITRO|nr:hypothetical protein PVL29_025666 [Vitis rotundifolia]